MTYKFLHSLATAKIVCLIPFHIPTHPFRLKICLKLFLPWSPIHTIRNSSPTIPPAGNLSHLVCALHSLWLPWFRTPFPSATYQMLPGCPFFYSSSSLVCLPHIHNTARVTPQSLPLICFSCRSPSMTPHIMQKKNSTSQLENKGLLPL